MANNMLATRDAERAFSPHASLDDKLMYLKKFGKPTLGIYGSSADSWHCGVSMHVASKGVSFDIKSDFSSLPTPVEAVDQCIERVHQTLKDLGVV